MPLHFERLEGMTPVADTFAAFFGNLPLSFWLDRESHPTDPFSVIGTGIQIEASDLTELSQIRNYFSDASSESALPFGFRPGIIGVLNYQSGTSSQEFGDFLAVDRAIVFDHKKRNMYFVGEFDSRKEFDFWYHAALLRLALLGGDSRNFQIEYPAATAVKLTAEQKKNDYISGIQKAQAHIADGDVYQLCLTNRIAGEYTGNTLSYFLRLRNTHRAPYAAFIKTVNHTYVSLSPERFLTVSDGIALSTPIKGTRPRSPDPEEDAKLKSQLELDPKERAENLMIVDLIRNDLSMVCESQSVSVEKLLEVVSYSTVHQLISEISGQLSSGKDVIDAVTALFPGGSMTGAPKSKAIELIAKLESSPRGGYSGAIGYFGQDGSCDLGMVIRTAIFDETRVSIGIGGGITIDSEPESEHKEIQLKATALVEELSAVVDW